MSAGSVGPERAAGKPASLAKEPSRPWLKELKRIERHSQALARRSAQLERQVAELQFDRSHPAAEPQVSRPPGSAELEAPDTGQQALLELRQSDPEAWDEMLTEVTREVLSDALEVHAQDEARAARAEAELEALLEQVAFSGTSAAEVRCSPSLCRFVLEHDSEADFEAFRDQGMLSAGLSGSEGFFDHDPESGQTTLYMAQGGEGLPSTEEALVERVLL